VTAAATEVRQRGAVLQATLNPHGSEVKTCKFEYGASALNSSAPCTILPGSGSSPVAVSATLIQLAPSTVYHYRISASNHGGTTQGGEASFQTLPAAVATVETGKAHEVLQRTAVVAATVNPNGGEVTSCSFEYGTTTLKQSAPCSKLPGSGTASVAVSAQLKGLTPNSTYLYRISATSPSGTSKGSEGTFKTTVALAPSAETKSASEVGEHGALLNATVNPNGAEVTSCSFEYGTTTLKQSVACSALPGLGTSAVAVSARLTGLSPNTTYRFRVSATSLSGTGKGTELSFKT
jgi:phosphodiesterase/alkaline phosphatase D-like protein